MESVQLRWMGRRQGQEAALLQPAASSMEGGSPQHGMKAGPAEGSEHFGFQVSKV